MATAPAHGTHHGRKGVKEGRRLVSARKVRSVLCILEDMRTVGILGRRLLAPSDGLEQRSERQAIVAGGVEAAVRGGC